MLRCASCGAGAISYNSCRDRHCPKYQSAAATRWLEARQADLLPVDRAPPVNDVRHVSFGSSATRTFAQQPA